MEQITIIKPIIALRALQMFYHNGHLLAKGPNFMSDHAMLGGFYAEVELQFDELSEYMIANLGNESYDTVVIADMVAQKLAQLSNSYSDMDTILSVGLALETELQGDLEELNSQASIGLQNFLGTVAELSDIRKYKLQQRLK